MKVLKLLFGQSSLPPSVGISSINDNIGSMEQVMKLTLTSVNIHNRNFEWTADGTLKNKIAFFTGFYCGYNCSNLIVTQLLYP